MKNYSSKKALGGKTAYRTPSRFIHKKKRKINNPISRGKIIFHNKKPS